MPKTRTELDLRLFDDAIEQDAVYSATDKQPFSVLSDMKEDFDAPVNYATLENDQWRLDGTMNLFPVDMNELKYGYWSLSQSDGNRDINVSLSINFTGPHTSEGLTFVFYPGEYATDVNIKWYDASNLLILDKTFTNDRDIFNVVDVVDNYKRIEVLFIKTNKPGHYLKLQEIGYGQSIIFSEEVLKAKIVEEIDTLSDEISINTMDTTLYIRDEEYISKIYSLLNDQQKIIAYEYINDARVPMGTFYLRNRSNPNNHNIELKTEDLLGAFSRTEYTGGIVNDTFENVISSIMASFGTTLYEISDELKNINVSGYIPVTDYRRAIQIVAFAVNAVVDCSRSSKINFYKLSTTNPQTVDINNIFTGPKQTELDKITGVSLSLSSYTESAETTEVYRVTHDLGTYKAFFTEPFTNLSIQNGTIVKSGNNYAEFTTTGGEVVITGNGYNVSTQVFEKNVPGLPPTVNPNVVKFENTIISDGQANVENMYSKLVGITERSIQMVSESESVGEYVQTGALYDKILLGYITEMSIDLTGGFVTTTKIQGVIQ